MISVTQPYLPSMSKYMKYVEEIYERNWLTNNGPLVEELTVRLEESLGVKNLLLTSSGTMALQLAFRVKNLNDKRVITTPFTFQATYSALEWQGANISFQDINKETWNLDTYLLEGALQQGLEVDCIVPVHTFGNPCDINHLAELQRKYKFDIIYDAAHAVTTQLKDKKSLLSFGDISCFSLHATKLFHTIEGGGVVFSDKDELAYAKQMINFGLNIHNSATTAGINGKLSEFHAAMGLAILDDLHLIEQNRLEQKEQYHKLLRDRFCFQTLSMDCKQSPSYMPILFESEQKVLDAIARLKTHDIHPRRYFYPAIHNMEIVRKHLQSVSMPNADFISQRVLCLPLYFNQPSQQINQICNVIKGNTL